jgi:hypothetical protein
MPTFYQGGSGMFVKIEAINDVEVSGGALRLRCRPSHTPANKAALVMDCNQIAAGALAAGIYGQPALMDLADHRDIPVILSYAQTALKRFAGDVAAFNTRSAYSAIRVDPRFAVNDAAWTLDMEVRFSNVATAYEVASVYAADAVTGRSWKLTYGGAQVFTLTLYGAGGATRTLTLDCTAWPLLANTWYDFRIGYNLAGPAHCLEIRRPSDNARITATGVDTIALQSPTSFDRPGLVFGGLFTYVEGVGLHNAKNAVNPYFQRATYYRSYLGTGLAAIAARPTYYAAATAGDGDGLAALCSLDSGAAGSAWDFATLSADAATNFATAIGAGGWEVRYQVADGAPSAWSAWMTWATLKTQADADGRYLHIGLRATSDGYNEFYPLAWIGASSTIPALPTTPVLSNYTRDEATGSVDTTGAAGETIEVWGASLFDDDASIVWEKIGERVGPGAVALDFTSFVLTIFGINILLPAKIVAVARNSVGSYSAMSNVLGALTGSSAGITTSGAALSPLGTLTFTVAGLADPNDNIAWFAINAGAMVVTMTTGNGPQTWVGGFDPTKDNAFIGFPQDRFGHLLFFPIFIEVAAPAPAAGNPYCRPSQDPSLEESP